MQWLEHVLQNLPGLILREGPKCKEVAKLKIFLAENTSLQSFISRYRKSLCIINTACTLLTDTKDAMSSTICFLSASGTETEIL